jgi:hypothetical protein
MVVFIGEVLSTFWSCKFLAYPDLLTGRLPSRDFSGGGLLCARLDHVAARMWPRKSWSRIFAQFETVHHNLQKNDLSSNNNENTRSYYKASKECVHEVLNRRQKAGYTVIEAQRYPSWKEGGLDCWTGNQLVGPQMDLWTYCTHQGWTFSIAGLVSQASKGGRQRLCPILFYQDSELES